MGRGKLQQHQQSQHQQHQQHQRQDDLLLRTLRDRCLQLEHENVELREVAKNACQQMVRKTNEASELREKLSQATGMLRRMVVAMERLKEQNEKEVKAGPLPDVQLKPPLPPTVLEVCHLGKEQ